MGYRDYSTAKGHIVDSTGHGDFTSVQAAINAASAGQTIFIRPGTYTENLNVNKNIVLTAYDGNGLNYDGGPNAQNVTIKGQLTCTSNAVTVNFTGLAFADNGASIFSEAAAHQFDFYFRNCYFVSPSNQTFFDYSGSGGVRLFFWECNADLNGNNAFFTIAGSGGTSVFLYDCNFIDTGGLTSATSNFSTTNGFLFVFNTFYGQGIFCFNNFAYEIENTTLGQDGTPGSAVFTASNTASGTIRQSTLDSNSGNPALSINVGASCTITNCTVRTSAANAFTGAGTVNYSGITFLITQTTNVTTETYFPLTVKQGGSGASTFTAYAPITAGTTTTGAFQVASTGFSTSGSVLTSTGASSLPTWQPISGGGLIWSDQSGAFNAVSGHGYFISAASVPTLPGSPSEGDTIAFIVDTASACTITGNTGQKIRIGTALSAAAGTAASTAIGDSVTLVYRTTGTTWFSKGAPEGTWTVT